MNEMKTKVYEFLKQHKICARCLCRRTVKKFTMCKTCQISRNDAKIRAKIRAGKTIYSRRGPPLKFIKK